ncbi:MAG TPA: UDP binding domain-containing protein, partial [Acidimicrobiales bacterium]|nr:UDP binding domain-containing protein [Acidimicrobiales bacterium]
SVNGSRILVLGLAYKRNTGDARESPAIAVVDQLLQLGADVRAADPHVGGHQPPQRVPRAEVTSEELSAADLVVLLTDHDEFDYGLVAEHARSILDTRRRLHACPQVEYL